MTVHVVVPTWNGADRLPSCLAGLAAQDHDDFEVVVVDNGSTDRTAAVLAELAAAHPQLRLVVLRNDVNLGFTGGVNRGIRHALASGSDAVALLNNDAVAEPGWLRALDAALDDHADAGIVTSRMLSADASVVDTTGDFYTTWGVAFGRDRGEPATVVRPSGYVFAGCGGASLYRRELFDDIGLFDDAYFAYLEDVDLSFRAQLAGHRIYYEAAAVVRHAGQATTATVSGLATRQVFRNLPLLTVKNVPLRLLPGVGVRLAIVYVLMLIDAVRRGEARPALGGAMAAVPLAVRGVRRRRVIQRARRITPSALAALWWPGLPSGFGRLARLVNRPARPDRPDGPAAPELARQWTVRHGVSGGRGARGVRGSGRRYGGGCRPRRGR